MAEATQQTDSSTQEQTLSPEARAAALGITLAQLNALENRAATPPVTAPTPAPSAPAIVPPRNRTYMGPNIGGPTNPQEFFGEYATQNRVFRSPTLAPPTLTPEQQGALQQRLTTGTPGESDAALLARMQAADRPGSSTIAVSRPPATASDIQFAAVQSAQKRLAAGEDAGKVWNELGPAITGRIPTMPTPGQQATIAERQRQFNILHPPTVTESTQPTVTDIGGGRSIVRVPGSKAWRLIDSKSGEPKAFTPAQAAGLLTKITQDEQAGSSPLSGIKDDLLRIVQSGATGTPKTTTGTTGGIQPPTGKKSFPTAPVTVSQRQKGQTYSTAKGNFVWTGTGWRKATE